jgi:deoxyribodipyrimidine photo-lyase
MNAPLNAPLIYWFRQDLRTHDLPALAAAAASGQPLVACYILDDISPGEHLMGSASRWWLHHSLQALARDLEALGGRLLLRRGESTTVLRQLLDETGASAIYCSRQYEPWADLLENTLHQVLAESGVTLKRFGGTLLFEPGTILNKSGSAFKVFTPFWRNCRAGAPPQLPRPTPTAIHWYQHSLPGDSLPDWRLCPTDPDWAGHWTSYWQPGSEGARHKLSAFLADKITDYSEGRNHPACDATSKLSAHLHFGELSPRDIWHSAQALTANTAASADQVDKFLSELGWREFSYHLLHHFPTLAEQPFKPQFSRFPWMGKEVALHAWQRGQTGYPLVDAGMRELWHTGYMHNRIRMVVASFLTKHLLVHWRAGARWFHDTLVDADLANNSCGWQWVAGSGADASPYFRIFNPITQGEKFDQRGAYIRRWVPELAGLPDRYLNRPWEAPSEILAAAAVTLGESYPQPIVDHRAARESALAAYHSIKTG